MIRFMKRSVRRGEKSCPRYRFKIGSKEINHILKIFYIKALRFIRQPFITDNVNNLKEIVNKSNIFWIFFEQKFCPTSPAYLDASRSF